MKSHRLERGFERSEASSFFVQVCIPVYVRSCVLSCWFLLRLTSDCNQLVCSFPLLVLGCCLRQVGWCMRCWWVSSHAGPWRHCRLKLWLRSRLLRNLLLVCWPCCGAGDVCLRERLHCPTNFAPHRFPHPHARSERMEQPLRNAPPQQPCRSAAVAALGLLLDFLRRLRLLRSSSTRRRRTCAWHRS